MSAVETPAAVHRSPLAERHRALGARLVAGGEWPASYGDIARERRALRERVGLLDVGPLDKVSLAGGRLAPPPPGPAFEVGRVTSGWTLGAPAQLWGLTDDAALLVVPAEGRRTSGLAASLESQGIPATDVSSLYAVLRLEGPAARGVLEELFVADVSERAVSDGAVLFGPLANVTVALARLDHGAIPSFTVLVERDHAQYLWDALLEIGRRHGIEPVGSAAAAED